MDNKEANLHILSNDESARILTALVNLKLIIGEICEENSLEGSWGVSNDCKYLGKQE